MLISGVFIRPNHLNENPEEKLCQLQEIFTKTMKFRFIILYLIVEHKQIFNPLDVQRNLQGGHPVFKVHSYFSNLLLC